MKAFAYLLCLISVCTANTGAVELSAGNLHKPEVHVTTEQEALTRALLYTGFDQIPDYEINDSAVLITYCSVYDDRTPYVDSIINSAPVWRLLFRDVPISWSKSLVKRDIEVLIDSREGNLLRIWSVSDVVGSADTLPESTSSFAEERLQKGGTIFNRIPEQLPTTRFFVALSSCFKNPATARIIKGFYIDYTKSDIRYPSTWIVILRGTETPMPSPGRCTTRRNDFEGNSQWYAIDAIAGSLIYFMNAPTSIEDIREYKKRR